MSSLDTEGHGFGAAMRDFGTALFIAASSTFGGVVGLIHFENQGDPFWLWASAAQLWAAGALAGYGLVRWARWRADPREARAGYGDRAIAHRD